MTESTRDRFAHWCMMALLVVIVLGGLLKVYPVYRDRENLQRQENELKEQIEAKRREIAKIRDNQRRFSEDTEFVETIARQNRRVFPGELVFIFQD